MGLQVIEAVPEAAPKDGNPVFPVDQGTGEMITAHWGARQGVSLQRQFASIAFCSIHRLAGSKTVEGSRGTSRFVARVSATVAACILWLVIGAVGDKGRAGESGTHAQAFVTPTEKGRQFTEPNAMRGGSSLVAQVVETMVVEQSQSLGRGRDGTDLIAGRLFPTQWSDAAQGKAAQPAQTARAGEQKQERDRAETSACAIAPSLGGELDAARSAAEAAGIEQRQALDQERDRADALARELDTARIDNYLESVQAAEAETKQRQALAQERDRADALARELSSAKAELDVARTARSKAEQAADSEDKQKRALEPKRDKSDSLARELGSLRAELDAARAAGSEAAQAADAERKRKQAREEELKQELKKEREGAEALARELSSLRVELGTSRAAGVEAGRTAEAAKIEQKLAFGKEHDKAETLARELASARKEAEERSARLAAAHAEVLQVTETSRATAAEQKLAFASERERAGALAQELASVRNQLEGANRQLASLTASRALISSEPAVDSPLERVAQIHFKMTEGKSRSPQQTFVAAVASTIGRSSASESPRPPVRSTTLEAAPESNPQVPMASEGSASASTAFGSPLAEQRLLARANALLRQADISSARPFLEHALERGSARAAFMLAETYDARVLQSWRARGISGNPAKARELYERAQAGGIEDAKERIEALK
jgi:hypothetical protein